MNNSQRKMKFVLTRYQTMAIKNILKEHIFAYDELKAKTLTAHINFIQSIIEIFEKELQGKSKNETNNIGNNSIPVISTYNNNDNNSALGPHVR